MKRLLTALFVLVFLNIGVIAQSKTPHVLAFLEEHEELSNFLALADSVGLTPILSNPNLEVTLFIPVNSAFSFLPEGMSFEDILADSALAEDIVLYHLFHSPVSMNTLLSLNDIETAHGEVIGISPSAAGRLVLNRDARSIEGDISIQGTVIHTISRVLIPETESTVTVADLPSLLNLAESSPATTVSNEPAEPCTVSADTANTVQVRVGPGENRTSVTFLATGRQFVVEGQTNDSDGNLWYRLNKEDAAPGRSINEAWVDSRLVDESGDCANVVDAAAPPLIPIVQQAPVTNTNTGGSDTGGSTGGSSAAPTAGLPANGRYTVYYAQFMNASCIGTGNITFPFSDTGFSMTESINVQVSGDTISINGYAHANVGGYYQGQRTYEGETVTSKLYPQTSSSFAGEIIISFQIDGVWCSGTVAFTAAR